MLNDDRPEGWWKSSPKIENGKVLCVAILESGEEITAWFSLEEIKRHLTWRVADEACAHEWTSIAQDETVLVCMLCGQETPRRW